MSNSVQYAGITSLKVDREGNLRLFRGWRQQVFHPRGEWHWIAVPWHGQVPPLAFLEVGLEPLGAENPC